MNNTLSVAAIENGTVIDHIRQGQAFRIIDLLNLKSQTTRVTVGLNLPSKSMGKKDIIKIENRVLTETEANEIVVFAAKATINVIEKFEVAKKINTRLPESLTGILNCKNPVCITKVEPITTQFKISERGKTILLTCHYCDHTINRDAL